jgi:hypothetical protein
MQHRVRLLASLGTSHVTAGGWALALLVTSHATPGEANMLDTSLVISHVTPGETNMLENKIYHHLSHHM